MPVGGSHAGAASASAGGSFAEGRPGYAGGVAKLWLTSPRRRVWFAGSAAMVVIGVLAVVSLHEPSNPSAPSAITDAPGSVEAPDPLTRARLAAVRRIPDDPLALGSLTAPVVVAEWGDFQCPLCRAFAMDTEAALIGEYVDSGRVRFEWHDLAYLGPESVLAARGARAAGRQGRFWQFHDALFRDQPSENTGALTKESLTSTARSLGLDLERFARDVDDPAIADAVERDQQDGARLGITRVPSFLINGEYLFGPQPVATFRHAIDNALAQGG